MIVFGWLLLILEISFISITISCGITIWIRDPKYIGNQFLGSGYICYGFTSRPFCFLALFS